MPHRLNIADLSERELQVLELSIQGMTDKSIAAELGLSVATVHTYWIRMKNKLGGATRAEVVAAAMSRSVNRTMAENQRLIQEVMRRAAVEEDLMRSQNVLQSIIDAAPDLIYLKDSSGRYEAVNTTFAASVGLTADEIIGKTDFDLYPEEEARRYQLSDRKVLQTGEIWEADDASTVEGERRTYHTVKFPIFDSTGNAESVGGISRDITRRKDLETELLRSQHRLKVGYEVAGHSNWELDLATGQVYWSSNTEALHGMEPGSFDGSYESYRKLVVPEDIPVLDDAVEKALRGDGTVHVEHRLRKGDGSIMWMRGRGQVLFDADGKPERIIGSGVDITQEIRAKHEASILAEQLRLAFDVAGIIHWTLDFESGGFVYHEGPGVVLAPNRPLPMSLEDVFSLMHPDDVDRVRQALDQARYGDGEYSSRYRLMLDGQGERRRVSRGRVRKTECGGTILVGVTMDDLDGLA
ncbi:MAG: PAS domain-containing protein [Fimbriimonadales bacterium]